MKMAGVLLAGGASTRMGRPKALSKAGPESFIAHGIRNLWCATDAVVIVLGAGASEIRRRTEQEFIELVGCGAFDAEVHDRRRHHDQKLEARFVVNRAWKRGMLSSARVGLAAALRYRPDAVIVLPVDHPHVKPATVHALATVMAQAIHAARTPRLRAGFSYAVVPRAGGRRGHPLVLSAALARAVARDAAAVDLSDAVRRNARLVGYLDVRDRGAVRNVNRPGD